MTTTALTPPAARRFSPRRLFTSTMETALFCKDALQGLAAGALGVIGAIHASTGTAPGYADGAFANTGIIEALAGSHMMGFFEIAIAAFLFLGARRDFARALGILTVFGYVIAINSGFEPEQLAAAAASVLYQLAEAIDPALMKMAGGA